MPKDPSPQISDDTVRAKTGKGWAEWFALLDAWGAAEKGHKPTAIYLAEEHGLSGWWAQSVTVEYEKARGLRATHQRADGRFEASVSRTFPVPPERVYAAWADGSLLPRWLGPGAAHEFREGGPFTDGAGNTATYRNFREPKTIRLNWEGEGAPDSRVELRLDAQADGKTRVTVTHSRLTAAEQVEQWRGYWSRALDALRELLAGER